MLRAIPPLSISAFVVGPYKSFRAAFLREIRRLRLRREPHRTRFPIVLVHGMLGFDSAVLRSRHVEYFRGVADHLSSLGTEVHVPRLPPLSGLSERSAALAVFVRTLRAKRVNIVAHSMGGLDARSAIAQHGIADRVASLVTIGTPHQGTPLADLGVDMLTRLGLFGLCQAVGISLDILRDVTSDRVRQLNETMPLPHGIACASVVSAVREGGRASPLLSPLHKWLMNNAGPNDGLVPASSQRFGEVLAEIETDHFGQMGWLNDFDALGLYANIVRELKARGY